MKEKIIVITTINELTKAVTEFVKQCPDYEIVLVGDKKSKPINSTGQIHFLSVEDQQRLLFTVTEHLPYNHYGRKNIGYLWSLQQGASLIYDTDDDNLPYNYWEFPFFEGEFDTVGGDLFCNIYRYYSDEFIWPRGFPLEKIKSENSRLLGKEHHTIGAWQGLADFDPDVDAIFRLLYTSGDLQFDKNDPLVLQQGSYCPFNSQNTLWNREMIPYAYLPVTVTFRFTDILRGIIAQRCFWEHGNKLGFTHATVYQERNIHDLLSDFKSEIPCYLEINRLVQILDDLSLNKDFDHNLLTIYGALAEQQLVQPQELEIVKHWIKDLQQFF